MARFSIYLFAIWTLVWINPAVVGVKDGLGVGIAIDQGAPDSVIAQKAGDLLLNCTVTFSPDLGDLKIDWLKDGSPVDLSPKVPKRSGVKPRVQLFENGSLYIKRVIHRPRKNRTDAGHYHCLATLTGVGTVIARDVTVQVEGIERKFDVEPQSQEVALGGVARFECRIQAVPPANYYWEFNKNDIVLPQNNNRYFLLENSGILQITGVRLSDVGLYRCYAAQGEPPKDKADRKYSAEAQLTVKQGQSLDVKIVSNSGNITSIVGSPATLECLVQGLNEPAEWRKDDQVITTSIDSRIERIGNNLNFTSTDIRDTGKYQCVAGRTVSQTIILDVIKKPVIVEGPGSVEIVNAGWQFLNCKAEGHPKPNITWYKDGQKLDLVSTPFNYRRGRFDHQLVIVQSEPFNSGYYQCFATNQAGSTSAIARVEITVQENAPGSPKNVRVLNVTSTTVLLAWDSPNKEPVLAYTVHYKKPDAFADDKVTQDTRIQLTGLSPFCNYTITVKPYTSVGAGTKSKPLHVHTKESLPLRPVDVTLESNSNSIRVTWSDMPLRDRQGVIIGYKLYYRIRDQPDTTKEVTGIPGSARAYPLDGLLAETEYEVRMIAGTSVGYPRFLNKEWPWTHIKTETENSGLIEPPKIFILPINSTTVNATWSIQGDNQVKQFVLKLEQLPSLGNVIPVYLTSQERFYVLYRLDENIRYELTLVVKTVDDSEAKVTKEFQTSDLPMVPRPTNLGVSLRTGTSLQVTWFQPVSELEIEYFSVRYRPLNGKDEKFSYLDSYTTSALLKNLDGNTMYNISVRANGQYINSLYSQWVVGSTKAAAGCDPNVTPCKPATDAPQDGKSPGTNEQRLGIVIGVSIGLFCIVICIVIIVMRNKCLTPHYNQQPMTQPARFHGNGHIPGNGNGHAVALQENRRSIGVYEMDAYTPMLNHLPENEDSDSKGGGGGNVILTPNGAKLNGFVPIKKNGVRNGQNHNGHHTVPYIPSQYNGEHMDSEERRGLIAAMLSGGNGQCFTGRVGEDSFSESRVNDLGGSLDGIDHSSCEDMLHATQESPHRDDKCRDIRDVSHSGSAGTDRLSTSQNENEIDSLPRSVRFERTDNNVNSSGFDHEQTESISVRNDDERLHGTAGETMRVSHDHGVSDVLDGDRLNGSADDRNHDGLHVAVSGLHDDIPHNLVLDTVPDTSGTREACLHGDTTATTTTAGSQSPIPHNQLSTSIISQASGSDDDPQHRGSKDPQLRGSFGTNGTTSQPYTGVSKTSSTTNNGGHVSGINGNCNHGNSDLNHHHGSNGLLPHAMRNGGPVTKPQGSGGKLCSTECEREPAVPQSPAAREVTLLSHGSRGITLDSRGVTLDNFAQIPQDAVNSAVKSSPQKLHYQV